MLKLLESISYRDTNKFPKLFLDYIDQKDELKVFYKESPDLKGFKKLIKERSSFSVNQREILKTHLQNQYRGIAISETVESNINLISDQNSFTVTTGHQLNLFTGPLYFIYKILTVINLSEELKKKFPDRNFIPVYWMASEDHDFEEIQYFNFNGKKYKWESSQKGSVGRFSLNDIKDYLKSLPIPEEYKSFYSSSSSLGEAHLKLVNHLFSDYGLLVLDADSRILKSSFAEVIKKDLHSQISFYETEKNTVKLSKLGYKTPVNARKVNYFFLDENVRERIEFNDSQYSYSSDEKVYPIELDEILSSKPENISPNVITRPVYQEFILPNLAYIGGPSELSYWLQLKGTFEALEVCFPLLIPRYSSSILSEKALEKLEKIGLDELKLLFREDRQVLKYLLTKSDSLSHEEHKKWSDEIENLFNEVKIEAIKKDKTLGPSVEGRKKKVLKELDKIQKKMETAEFRNQDILKDRFFFAKEELFPNGSFQERYDNVLQYLMENELLIRELKHQFPNSLEFSHSLLKS